MSAFAIHYNEFHDLLDTVPAEQAVHTWLESHPIAFGSNCVAISKAPLGSEYQVDFLLVQNITVGFTWRIVELKRPSAALFRRDDLPTDDLNSAVAQAERYQAWIRANACYAQQSYPEIFQPPACILLGRRAGLNERQREQLRQMNTTRSVVVRTYDSLLEDLRFVTEMDEELQNALAEKLVEHLPSVKTNICWNAMPGERR